MLLFVVVLAAAAWSQQGGGAAVPGWVSGRHVISTVDGGDRPTLTASPGDAPLGTPAPIPSGGGRHLFSATQPGSAEPVAYDPCRPNTLVINSRTAPEGHDELLTEAVAQISLATGLRFDVEGSTVEAPSATRPAFLPGRYGDRWAPVLIAWSDPAELADLEGNVAGFAGSTRLDEGTDRGVSVYVSGIVVLDGPQLTEMLGQDDGRAQVRGVIPHELAHLVGLDHVDDPTQLMLRLATRASRTFKQVTAPGSHASGAVPAPGGSNRSQGRHRA